MTSVFALPDEIVTNIIGFLSNCPSCGLSTCDLGEGGFWVVLGRDFKCVACGEGKQWDPFTQTGYALIEREVQTTGLDGSPLGPGQIYRSWKYLEKGRYKGSAKKAGRDDRERTQKKCRQRRAPTTLQVVGYTEYGEEIVDHVPSPGRRHDPRKCDLSCAEECRQYVDALRRRPPRRRTARLPASA